jgi:hypothetical protein
VRVDVAMVATKVRRSGRRLKRVLFRVSGECVLKIWRDKDRRPDTIKVIDEKSREGATGTEPTLRTCK